MPTNHCNPNPCQNGGECILTPHGPSPFICDCINTDCNGQYCEICNPCDPNPCQNGGECSPTCPSCGTFDCDCTDTGCDGQFCEDCGPIYDKFDIYVRNNCGVLITVKAKLRDATPGHIINGQLYTHVTKFIEANQKVYFGKQDRRKVTFKKIWPSYLAESYQQQPCVGGSTNCRVDAC